MNLTISNEDVGNKSGSRIPLIKQKCLQKFARDRIAFMLLRSGKCFGFKMLLSILYRQLFSTYGKIIEIKLTLSLSS